MRDLLDKTLVNPETKLAAQLPMLQDARQTGAAVSTGADRAAPSRAADPWAQAAH